MTDSEVLIRGLLEDSRPSTLEIIQIPEIERLEDVPQDPEHHPEGNAYIHSMQVLDRAAGLKVLLPEKDHLALMLAAWLHDVGKWDKTFYKRDKDKSLVHWTEKKPRNTRIVSYGHDTCGGKMVPEILSRFFLEQEDLIEKVSSMVTNHMKPLLLSSARLKVFRKMEKNNVPLILIGILNWADKGDRAHYWFRRIKELRDERT